MDAVFTTRHRTVIVMTNDELPGERLRRIRERLGMGVREVARRSEGAFTHAYVSKLETSESPWSKASLGVIKGFARAFGMSIDQVIREVDGRTELQEAETPDRNVPVYSWVSAGPGLEGGEVIEHVDIPITWRGEFRAYRIEGDSMAPRIPAGSTVIVKVTQKVHPGQIVVAYIPEAGMVLKNFERITDDGVIILTSFNPQHDPVYTREMHVYGHVYEVRTRYKNAS